MSAAHPQPPALALELRQLADTAPVILWMTDASGACVFLSRGWFESTGQSEAQSLGFGWLSVVHPEDREKSAQLFREANAAHRPFTFDYRLRQSNGEYRWAVNSGNPRFGERGEFLGFVGNVIDIHERVRGLMQEMERREETYRQLVESQGTMLCRFRPDGTILFVNGAYARARGSTSEAMSGQNFWNFIPREDHAGVRAMLAGLTPENPEVRIENRYQTAEGLRWTLWFNRALTFDEQGHALELQSTGVDITDRRRAEEELLEADRRKDEFLAILSHELRNPLAPIRNHVARLRASGGAPGVLEEALPVLDRQVAHLVRLVDDLLDVARINRGDIVLQKRAVPLAEIVTTALETSRPLIEARGHRLSVQLPGKPVIVMGDPVRLSQVLANVLNNAATYTPAGGQIHISVDTEQDRGVLRVRDNGPGFTAATGQHMFELFRRGEDARNHPAGFGIGLALARRLIEMHEGTIRAESAGPNLGSEFFITLPIERAAAATPDAAPARTAPMQEKKVLVVDDNVDAAESLALLLSATGAETAAVFDGPAALTTFAKLQPDVVLLDIGMPGMDGFEVARHIRERWPKSGVKLVALTGWGQEEDRRRTTAAGFDHHLVKPAGLEEIEEILARG